MFTDTLVDTLLDALLMLVQAGGYLLTVGATYLVMRLLMPEALTPTGCWAVSATVVGLVHAVSGFSHANMEGDS